MRDLRRLEKPSVRRILQTVELLKAVPYLGKNLRGQLERLRSLRVGDFKVVYSIDESRSNGHAAGRSPWKGDLQILKTARPCLFTGFACCLDHHT